MEALSTLIEIAKKVTPAVVYGLVALLGLYVAWQAVKKKPKVKAEDDDEGVAMKIIEEVRGDVRRVFDKLDELQKTVLKNYATKEEVEEIRAELRESRDKVIRLETEMESVQRQLAIIPKRSGD